MLEVCRFEQTSVEPDLSQLTVAACSYKIWSAGSLSWVKIILGPFLAFIGQ